MHTLQETRTGIEEQRQKYAHLLEYFKTHRLLTRGVTNPKTKKNGKTKRFLSYILHLRQYKTDSVNICPWARNCARSCLGFSGHGGMGIKDSAEDTNRTQEARIRKTRYYVYFRDIFMKQLRHELDLAGKLAKKQGLELIIRLNGTSDLDFSEIIKDYQDIQFYDYTKGLQRLLRNKLPNYHLTFSFDGLTSNWAQCKIALSRGFNVAVAFKLEKGQSLPKQWMGYQVYDADRDDLRFMDEEKGQIAGLKAKGHLPKTDKTGFFIAA